MLVMLVYRLLCYMSPIVVSYDVVETTTSEYLFILIISRVLSYNLQSLPSGARLCEQSG